MQFIELEQPIAELYAQIEKARETEEKTGVDMSSTISDVEQKIDETREKLFEDLTPWQKVQLSRHPNRPYTLDYIDMICDEFVELHGDRNFADDKAIVGGLAKIDGQSYMVIGHQKGKDTKSRQERNFGMANPEGYRKAMRLMRLAEKFNIPIVTFIDTPGAYPGLEAEERGQAQAIAQNLYDMIELQVPVCCIVIGEGASGGALGIGVGDRIYMMEYTWYTVISPESCSTILWKDVEHKEEAADQLKLTPEDMLSFGLIDGIIEEPLGGAHTDYEKAGAAVKACIINTFNDLKNVEPEQRVLDRIERYSNMGIYDE